MEDRRLLGIRAWIWGVALVSLAAVGILAALWISDGTKVAVEPPDAASESPPTVDPSRTQTVEAREPVFAPDPPEEPPPPSKTPPAGEDMEYAIPVFDNDLVVTLASHPGLGQISIERYDSNGNPTGEPLKQGTPVQIPDPDRPGEKIYFRVP